MVNFLENIKDISDHPTADKVLLVMLVGVLCGADDWEVIERAGFCSRSARDRGNAAQVAPVLMQLLLPVDGLRRETGSFLGPPMSRIVA